MPRTSSLAAGTAAGGSTWSAMIGAAASPGALPIAWPERIASLTMLSRPHPASFARALKIDLQQPHRSRHHQELLDPDAGQKLLAENGRWVRDRLARHGVPREAIENHLSLIGNPPTME